MEPWLWLTAYVGGFGLLQVLLYRHFRKRTPAATDGQVDASGGARTAAADATEAVPCQQCGTVNEVHAAVRYCRECAQSIR
jgi:hypothetical protein